MPEFSEFFTDLQGRRQRLLQLVRPDDDRAALIEELTELGEQLVIAEEELRVQQEELTAAGSRVRSLLSEREELRSSAPYPYVLTDRRGVVLRANPAADRLIRRPAVRATPRPIASWFEVADRPAIRTAISRLAAGRDDQVELRATLSRSDLSTLAVHVSVTGTAAGDHAEPELLWRLEAEPVSGTALEENPPAAGLRLVGEPEPGTAQGPTAAQLDYASRLTSFAEELAACETEEHLLSVAVESARRLIPHAQHAGVLLSRRRGETEQAASAGEPAATCLHYELALAEGPALAALTQRSPVAVVDSLAEPRWPTFGQALTTTGIRSVLAVGVPAGERVLGVLAVYADRPAAFDADAAVLASLVATQLGLALAQLRSVQNLQAAMVTRAQIGEALGVLMERFRITSQDAFARLTQASQRNNVKLHDIARHVAETGQDPTTIRLR